MRDTRNSDRHLSEEKSALIANYICLFLDFFFSPHFSIRGNKPDLK